MSDNMKERESKGDKKIGKKGYKFKDVLFLFLSAITAVISAKYVHDVYKFRQTVQKGVEIRSLFDFVWILVAALFFGLGKRVFHWIFYKPCLSRLEKRMSQRLKVEPKKTQTSIDVVKVKLTKNLFDGCWYMFMFFFGLATAYNDPNMPFFYLGSGSWDSLGDNWPNHNFGMIGRLYFIFHLGHHYHNLIHHSIAMKDIGNYYELILHHVITTGTTTFAYYSGFEEYALFTLLSHDISDSILNFSKFFRDMNLPSNVLSLTYVILLVSWIVSRLTLAPMCYWIGTQRLLYWKNPYGVQHQEAWDSLKYGVNVVCVKTLLLVLLNLLWLYWLIEMGYNKFFKGHTGYVSVQEGESNAHNEKRHSNGISGDKKKDK